MAKDTFGSSLMEECGHKCSRLPLNVVSVNGCQDVKPKVITALNGALDSARVPHPGVWLINTGGSGREEKGGQERRGRSPLATGGPHQLGVTALRRLVHADEPVF